MCGIASDSMATPGRDEFVLRTFNGLYEPSAAIVLQGQGVVIFEDDGREMISFHSVVQDNSGFKLEKQISFAIDIDITDIEGAAHGTDSSVFAITSHSRNKKNLRNEKREQFIQLELRKGQSARLLGNAGLREAIVAELLNIDPSLADQATELNIEGICFSKAGEMLIGLRGPLYKGKAIVVSLLNPYEIASDSFIAQFSEKPLLFDLGGAGVRAMAYSDSSDEFFFVSEVETKKKNMRPRLWSWDGEPGHAVVRVAFPGLKKMRNIEGLTFLSLGGKNRALFVCDDGNKKKKQGAHYAIVDLSVSDQRKRQEVKRKGQEQ